MVLGPCHDPRMRYNALHASEDPEVVRRLIREHPWGTLVSHHDRQLAASHYPILLDEAVKIGLQAERMPADVNALLAVSS